jgi:hypothetical protein
VSPNGDRLAPKCDRFMTAGAVKYRNRAQVKLFVWQQRCFSCQQVPLSPRLR